MNKREVPKTITKRTKRGRDGQVTGHVWRARYFIDGQEHSKHFTRKIDAQNWLDEVTADIVKDEYIMLPLHQQPMAWAVTSDVTDMPLFPDNKPRLWFAKVKPGS